MQRQRFAEEPMLRMLPEAEPLDKGRAVCRQHHVSAQTVSRWRQQRGGMAVADAKRLRTLEREHAALTRRGGARPLDKRMRKAGVGKPWAAWLSSATRPRCARVSLSSPSSLRALATGRLLLVSL
jgi:putative transposase